MRDDVYSRLTQQQKLDLYLRDFAKAREDYRRYQNRARIGRAWNRLVTDARNFLDRPAWRSDADYRLIGEMIRLQDLHGGKPVAIDGTPEMIAKLVAPVHAQMEAVLRRKNPLQGFEPPLDDPAAMIMLWEKHSGKLDDGICNAMTLFWEKDGLQRYLVREADKGTSAEHIREQLTRHVAELARGFHYTGAQAYDLDRLPQEVYALYREPVAAEMLRSLAVLDKAEITAALASEKILRQEKTVQDCARASLCPEGVHLTDNPKAATATAPLPVVTPRFPVLRKWLHKNILQRVENLRKPENLRKAGYAVALPLLALGGLYAGYKVAGDKNRVSQPSMNLPVMTGDTPEISGSAITSRAGTEVKADHAEPAARMASAATVTPALATDYKDVPSLSYKDIDAVSHRDAVENLVPDDEDVAFYNNQRRIAEWEKNYKDVTRNNHNYTERYDHSDGYNADKDERPRVALPEGMASGEQIKKIARQTALAKTQEVMHGMVIPFTPHEIAAAQEMLREIADRLDNEGESERAARIRAAVVASANYAGPEKLQAMTETMGRIIYAAQRVNDRLLHVAELEPSDRIPAAFGAIGNYVGTLTGRLYSAYAISNGEKRDAREKADEITKLEKEYQRDSAPGKAAALLDDAAMEAGYNGFVHLVTQHPDLREEYTPQKARLPTYRP